MIVFTNTFAKGPLSLIKTKDKSIYIELLGASNLIGISFDSRFASTSNWGYRIGWSYFQGGESFVKSSNSNKGSLFPIEINYLAFKNKHKLEVGFGSNIGVYKEYSSYTKESKTNNVTIETSSTSTFGYYLYANIGYRYVSNRGLLFRVGLCPSFNFNDKHGINKEPFIYPYISLGYSF